MGFRIDVWIRIDLLYNHGVILILDHGGYVENWQWASVITYSVNKCAYELMYVG